MMSLRLYRLLLHFYPRSFRHEYGGEMALSFADRCSESRGAFARAALWFGAIPDLLSTALWEHWCVLRQDTRFALRAFRRAPAYPLIAIAVIALGVGANTAIFTAVDRALIRPLPYRDPSRLMMLWESNPTYPLNDVAAGNFIDWRSRNDVFAAMAAYTSVGAERNLTGAGPPVRLAGIRTTSSLFPLLGIPPALGRAFLEEDEVPGGPPLILLSHPFWQGRLGGDDGIVGRDLVLDGVPHRVIGVMPGAFVFPHQDVDYWLPLRLDAEERLDRTDTSYKVIARLRDGATLDEARSAMKAVAGQLAQAYPESNREASVVVRPLRDEIAPASRLALLLLYGAAVGVLLIGCANLANLLLMRGAERRRELAVRAALGAGKERLVRQILTENFILAGGGGMLGVLAAYAALPLLAHLMPASLPISTALRIDGRVLAFTMLVTITTGCAFALYPAWRLSRDAARSGLREGARRGAGAEGNRFRYTLVVTELAVSMVLLVCTGLLIRALVRISDIDPGFRIENVMTLRTSLPADRYEERDARQRFYDDVLARVRSLPGVLSAGYTGFLPFVKRGIVWPVGVEGDPAGDDAHAPTAVFRIVTEGYLETMGIPILKGRDFDPMDTSRSPGMAIISASFAERFWPASDPIGRSFSFLVPWMEGSWTVAGVAPDIRARWLERAPGLQVYLLHRQAPGFLGAHAPRDLAIHAAIDPRPLLPALRRIIADVDPGLPITDERTMDELFASETAGRRHQLRLLGVFAALAFLMAALGIYGVVSFMVAQRAQELGVRIALGARASDIMRLVLGRGIALIATGMTIGLAAGFIIAGALRHLLFGVQPSDPLALIGSAALCLAASLPACLIPALRAARIDAMTAIRAE